MGTCFAIVPQDQYGALESLGKFQKELEPGCFPKAPWATVKYVSSRIQENKCNMETKTKDNVSVRIEIAVQQEVSKDKVFEAIYKLTNPDAQIDSFVTDAVRPHVPRVTLDSLFETKEEIASAVKGPLSVKMLEYGYHILNVLVVDIDPDPKVKQAMNQINLNRRLRMAAQEKAEADKIILVKAAEAEAESKFLQGQGLARSRAAIITGLRDAVAGPGSKEQLSAKDVTELLLMTQYLDTLEKLASGPATTIFMPHNPSEMHDISRQVRDGFMQAGAIKK